MSGISPVKSVLPEDIEQKLANVQRIISDLELQKNSMEKDVEIKRAEQIEVEKKLSDSKIEHARIVSEYQVMTDKLNERENQISQKESALNVYANALEEKENRINKYLAIFENMKGALK